MTMAYFGVTALLANLALVFVVSTSGQAPPVRPRLSESFSAEYTRSGLGTELRGSIYRIYEEGKQFQVEQMGGHDGLVNTLTRADLKTQYKYFLPFDYCSSTSDPSISVVRAWIWIDKAKYVGLKEFKQRRVNVWAYNDTQKNVYSEMGVSAENANEPVFIFDDSAASDSFGLTVFQTFINTASPPSKFDVPKICEQN